LGLCSNTLMISTPLPIQTQDDTDVTMRAPGFLQAKTSAG